MPRKSKQGHIYDWATTCAERIDVEYGPRRNAPSISRLAAVIALHAEPILKLLDECGRGTHSKGYNEESADYPPCPKSGEDADDAKCTCNADKWNERVRKALSATR